MAEQPSSTRIVYVPPVSFFKRLRFALKLHVLKFLISAWIPISNLPGIRNNSRQPSSTKIYPCQPGLTHRIFIPKSYKDGDGPLPLYLDIHGGGFALMNPIFDDEFCSYFSNANKILIISLDYPKSPTHKFPAPVEALVDVVNAVLEDESLPVDKKKKVVVGGFSAGANLSLALTQHESLQGRIGGVVGYYPPVDLTTPIKVSLATRPKDAPPDSLENDAVMFNWGYLQPGQDLRDPLLSVTYAERSKLPEKICIVGCEHDLLCRDAEIMVDKWAGAGDGGGDRTTEESSWERNGVKWEKILGEPHGFDFMPSFGDKKMRRHKRKLEMYEGVAEWLFREVYH